MNCIFCDILSGDIPSYIVYEDGDVLAFLDAKPVNVGHTLVIPKAHYPNLMETPDEVVGKLFIVAKKIAGALMELENVEGVNIGMNNHETAGQVIFHSHVHVMPRTKEDTYDLWHGNIEQTHEGKQHTADTIKSNLST